MRNDPLPWSLATDRDDGAEADDIALIAEGWHTARLCTTGLTAGLVLAKLIDWLSAGPGLRVMVGL